jgi:hypothetical protein
VNRDADRYQTGVIVQNFVPIVTLLLAQSLTLTAGAAPQIPDWVNRFPQRAEESATSSATEAKLSYSATVSAVDVAAYYERQLRTNGIVFVSGSNGVGVSIRASKDETSCVIRIEETDSAERNGGSRVTVGCMATTRAFAPKENPIPAGDTTPQPVKAKLSTSMPVEDWPQLRWGMADGEVLAAFHGDAKVLTGHSLTRQFRDRVATIGIDEVSIGGVSLQALFLFDPRGGLDRIYLILDSAKADEFEKIEVALSRKHGEPFRGAVRRVKFASTWLLQNTVIYMDYYPTLTTVNLRFDKRIDQSRESLLAGLAEVHGRHVLTSTLSERDHSTTIASDSAGGRVRAKSICERFTSQTLKAPATARFSQSTETVVSIAYGATYRVGGWVDSQNSFGALLRTRYACWVEYAGSNRWNLLSLDLR